MPEPQSEPAARTMTSPGNPLGPINVPLTAPPQPNFGPARSTSALTQASGKAVSEEHSAQDDVPSGTGNSDNTSGGHINPAPAAIAATGAAASSAAGAASAAAVGDRFYTAAEIVPLLPVLDSDEVRVRRSTIAELFGTNDLARGSWSLESFRYIVNGKVASGAIVGLIAGPFDKVVSDAGNAAFQSWTDSPPQGINLTLKGIYGKSQMTSVKYSTGGMVHDYTAYLPIDATKEMNPASIKRTVSVTPLAGSTAAFSAGMQLLQSKLANVAGSTPVNAIRADELVKAKIHARLLAKGQKDPGYSDPAQGDPLGILAQFAGGGWDFNNEPTVSVPIPSLQKVLKMRISEVRGLPANTLYEIEAMPSAFSTWVNNKPALGWNLHLVDIVIHGLVVKQEEALSPNAGRKRTFDFAKLAGPSTSNKRVA